MRLLVAFQLLLQALLLACQLGERVGLDEICEIGWAEDLIVIPPTVAAQSILHGLLHTLYRHRTVLWILEPACCSYQSMGNAVWALWLRRLFNFHQKL